MGNIDLKLIEPSSHPPMSVQSYVQPLPNRLYILILPVTERCTTADAQLSSWRNQDLMSPKSSAQITSDNLTQNRKGKLGSFDSC